jgi:hypothetical protein
MNFLNPGELVSQGVKVSLSEDNRVVISTSVDIYDHMGQLVGYCTALEEIDARGMKVVRPISFTNPGRIVDMVPQVESVTLRITGFSLYNDEWSNGDIPHYSLLNRLAGFNKLNPFRSLVEQRIPFDLKYTEEHPGAGMGMVFERGWRGIKYYKNCYLTNTTISRSIGNVTVSETASVQVSYIDGPVVGNLLG